MLQKATRIVNDFASPLLSPHLRRLWLRCAFDNNSPLCVSCLYQLPETGFDVADNPVERKFYGQLKIAAAGCAYYFTKHSLLQHLVKQLKYKGNKDIGIFLGKQLGKQLAASERFNNIDCIIPLPLNQKKESRRGYKSRPQ